MAQMSLNSARLSSLMVIMKAYEVPLFETAKASVRAHATGISLHLCHQAIKHLGSHSLLQLITGKSWMNVVL